jgi:hypothetical protein
MARRFKDIIGAIITDQGGIDRCSESRLQLVRRFAAAAVLAERLESRIANGEDIDVAEHAVLCSTLVRIAQRIGINRTPKTIATLADYLERCAAEARPTLLRSTDEFAAVSIVGPLPTHL